MQIITPEKLINPYYDIIADPNIPYGPEMMMTTIERKCVLAVALAHDQGCKAMFEFGTYEGFTTAVLAKAFPQKTIYTLDLPPEEEHDENPGVHLGHHYKSNKCDNVVQILQDSRTFDPSDIPPCDFTLVDADHQFNSVFNDFGFAYYLLVAGGALMADDIFMAGPEKAINLWSAVFPEYTWVQILGTKLAYCTINPKL